MQEFWILVDLLTIESQLYYQKKVFLLIGGIAMDARNIGHNIKRTRKSRGLTQAELAQMVDITPKYLSNLECGEKIPKLETFISIANALKCDANSLLCDALDVAIPITSSSISDKLAALPLSEQRRFLRIIEFMVDDAMNHPLE